MKLKNTALLSLILFLIASLHLEAAEFCPPAKIQDFLLPQTIRQSDNPTSALNASIAYRVNKYGTIPDTNLPGNNPNTAPSQNSETIFLGLKVNLHKRILAPLDCVEKAILKNCPDNAYNPEFFSGLRTKNTYRGGQVSNHMFGIALDIDPAYNPCCGCVPPWSDNPVCQVPTNDPYTLTNIPKCWVLQFEKFGFYWLGFDKLQDTMHFEFLAKPETFELQSQKIQCPQGMIDQGEFCIDQFEAPNKEGQKPFVARTATEGEKWCQDQGKELCSDEQWEFSCSTNDQFAYPYGDNYQKGKCNDDKIWRVPNWQLIARYRPENPDSNPQARDHVNSLNQSDPSGSRSECSTPDGIMDLTGNAAEWVRNTKRRASSSDGKINDHVMKGCYWSGCYKGARPTCGFTNPNHHSSFRSYESGFRCCLKK